MRATDHPGFRASMDALLPYRTRIAALTSLAVNGSFVLVDALALPPALLLERTAVRCAFTPAFVILMWLATHEAGRRSPQAVVLGLSAVVAAELALLGSSMPAADNVGFFPAMLFFAAFLPLPRRATIAVACLFIGAFLAVHLTLGASPLPAVLKHAGNLLMTGVIATVAAGLSEKLARSEFNAVRELAAASQRLVEARRLKDDQEREVTALSQLADERRRLSAAVLSAQDAERRRLALELHDGAGQILVGALLHLDLALRSAGSPELASTRSLVAQALADLRSVSRDLHPPALQQHGLVGALRQLAESLSTERTPVEAALEAMPELAPATALGLFRIAQSALTNTVRHARASRAMVRLSVLAGNVVLEVEDDGIGYAPERTDHGIGVPGMRERAASLGGALVIQSALGEGTRVQAAVPLGAARH